MHLFALDPIGNTINANQASKKQDYYCLECHGVVRRRSGNHRTPHYFHLNSPKECLQQGKSLVHLQIQCLIKSCLPSDEVILEYRFPKIKRIADVAWITQGIIFEVQCSPISPEEILARHKDYQSEGFIIVWILHDRRYNKKKLSAAEDYLLSFPHYFTSIDELGQGLIYDQHHFIKNGIRLNKQRPLKIDLNTPMVLNPEEVNLQILSKMLNNRLKWPIYFSGDSLHQFLQNPIMQIDTRKDTFNFLFDILRTVYFYIVRPYDLFFKVLLEKACK